MYLGNTGHNQTVREVQVAPGGAVVLGVLDGPDALLAVLVGFLGTEVVVEVALQTVAGSGIDGGIGVLHHLLQVFGADARHLVAAGIVLTICLVEVDLGQEGGSGSLGGTALVSLCHGQHQIGSLQVVDDLLPALVVGVLGVRQVVIVVLGHVQFVDKGNLLEQTLQLEMSVGTQEQHLAGALLDGGIVLVSLIQHVERQRYT